MKPNKKHLTSNLFNYLFFACALIGLYYVVVRSFSVGFTHDESITYTMVKGEKGWLLTANNHWLNTVFATVFSKILGFKEWVLRLPNVLAYGVFIWYTYILFTSVQLHKQWISLLILFLLLNPFLIQYFSVCRGYGMALTGFLIACYYLFLFVKTNKRKPFILFLGGMLIMVYANYAFLMPCLALCISFWVYIRWIEKIKFTRFLIPFILFLGALIPAFVNVWYLQKHEHLMFGGDNNVMEDTLWKTIHPMFETESESLTWFTVIFLLLLIVLAWKNIKQHKTYFLFALTGMLLLIGPTVANLFLGMKYPMERAALYWIVLFTILLVFALQKEWRKWSKIILGASTLLVCVGSISNFILRWNVQYFDENKTEAEVPLMLHALEERIPNKQEKYTLGIPWFFEPTINYYREVYDYNWLLPVNRSGVDGAFDYYYLDKNKALHSNTCMEQLLNFPLTNTQLLSRCNKNTKSNE